MQCKKCQHEIPAESSFCPKCGAQLTAQADKGDDPGDGPRRMQSTARGRGTPPNETELWTGTYSPKAMAGTFLAAGALTVLAIIAAAFTGPGAVAIFIGIAVAWVVLLLLLVYRRMTVRYRLSTFRFFHDTGLLSRTGNRVEVIDIDDVTVHQGLIERMFGVGTIFIRSSDTTDPELHLPGIDDVKRIADLIDGTRRAERQRRGMFMENV